MTAVFGSWGSPYDTSVLPQLSLDALALRSRSKQLPKALRFIHEGDESAAEGCALLNGLPGLCNGGRPSFGAPAR